MDQPDCLGPKVEVCKDDLDLDQKIPDALRLQTYKINELISELLRLTNSDKLIWRRFLSNAQVAEISENGGWRFLIYNESVRLYAIEIFENDKCVFCCHGIGPEDYLMEAISRQKYRREKAVKDALAVLESNSVSLDKALGFLKSVISASRDQASCSHLKLGAWPEEIHPGCYEMYSKCQDCGKLLSFDLFLQKLTKLIHNKEK